MHGAQQARSLLDNVTSEFSEYQLACYLYGFSSFLEVMLQKEFESTHLESVSKKMRDLTERYNSLYTECHAQIGEYQRSAIETKLLGGLGSVAKAAGEFLATVPVLKDGPVDEALIGAGESLGRINRDAVAKKLEQFAPLEDNRMAAFIDSIKTLDVLYNEPAALLTDGESLYILEAA